VAEKHPLDGAIEKFNRSKEQFDELPCELRDFFDADPKPHGSVGLSTGKHGSG
jgi:hypothetical protein